MVVRFLVFFGVVMLVLGSAHYYVWIRLVRDAAWSAPWGRVASGVLVLLFVLMMTAFLAMRALPRSAAAPFTWIGFTWLGVVFFLVLSLGLADLVKRIAVPGGSAPVDPDRRQAISRLFGGAAALLGLGTSAVGLFSALSPVAVRRVRVAIDRLSKGAAGYRIVQITDVHVGPTIGKEFIEAIVARINALKPDLVAITGDLVDGSVAELAEHVAPLG